MINSSGSSSTNNQKTNDNYSSSFSSLAVSIIVTSWIAVLAFTTISTSIISGSSPQSLWSVINLFQLFILYPMIGAFVPAVVIKFLQGVDFCLFNFNFISIPSSDRDLISSFGWIEASSYLSSIGIPSVCMIVNQIKLLFTFISLIFIHIPIYLIFKRRINNSTNWGKISKAIFMFFTFTIYLRTIIESYFIV